MDFDFQPSPVFLGLNALGGVVKHIIPGKMKNKLIPIINYGAALVFRKAMGMPWSGAAISAFYDTGAASVSYETVRNTAAAIKERKSI